MAFLAEKTLQKFRIRLLYEKYLRFHSSLYGRVIYIIILLSLILFFSFGIIFRSVYEDYLNTVIRQCGNNVVSIVEGALYHSMLKNDKGALQSTLDVIHTLPGVDDVNMYNKDDELVYSSYAENEDHSDPNCLNCHAGIRSMFGGAGTSYKIIDEMTACSMTASGNGHRQLMIRAPIYNQRSCYVSACHAHNQSETELGSLIVKVPLQNIDRAVQESSRNYFILAAITTILLGAFLIVFTQTNIKNPLKEILGASEAVARGDKSTRLDIKRGQPEDLKTVSKAFNNMLDNLDKANKELENWSHQLEYKVQKKSEELSEMQNELIHVERIASIGKLSSSVAHEINNPLSGVLTYTKLVQKQLNKMNLSETEPIIKYLKIIETETKRCGDIVRGLLDFSRKDRKNFEARSIHRILKDTYNLMAHQMKIADIYFYTDFQAKEDEVVCSENQIKQACVAILVNALEAVSEHGEVLIKTTNPDESHIRIDISDNGVGIAQQDLAHIFEPFFSAKHKTSGIGLGLAIVHGIVENHKGKIDIKSAPGEGTTLSINLSLSKITAIENHEEEHFAINS
ncbi:MAG: hypothetical protein KDC05_00120 [Bacteroidales bacterium]|nr:hypothetical protein [Bacteroidales bacterium]